MRTFDEMHADCNRAGHPCVYWGEHGDWLCVLGQSRDSDTIERSNFAVAVAELEKIDPDCYQVENENHWAVGWVETLLVNPACAAAVEYAERILAKLDDYPILEEEHHSEMVFEEYIELWDSWGECEWRREIVERLESRGLDRLAALVYDLDLAEALEFARQQVSWEYEFHGTECLINIGGLVDCLMERPNTCGRSYLYEAVRDFRAKRTMPVPIVPMPKAPWHASRP